ncbi:hypothetical protein ACHAW6_012975 [Cyclotella cf. meneghiniana]
MKLGEFARKCKETSYYLHCTEPYYPWELKKGAAKKLTCSGAPRWLCCFALEYESYICLHTALDIFQLNGCIPEMFVLAHSVNLAYETGFSSRTDMSLFLMTRWYLANTLVSVLMWGLQ